MQDALLAHQPQPAQPFEPAQQFEPALPFRSHTVLGVCEGLGEDLGIPPTLLRVAFAGSLFWNPAAAFGAYLALGLVVLAARLLFPAPRRPLATRPAAAPLPEQHPQEELQQELQLAA